MLDSEQTATVKSPPAPMIEMRIRTPLPRAGCLFLLVTFCLLCSGPALVTMGAELSSREETERHYREAKADYRKKSNSEKVAVRFGEACFDWADFAENDSQRAGLAEEGIAAMRELLLTHQNSPGGLYYLGLNLGQLARTKTLGALPIVREMERTFKASIAADPKYNRAGAHRSLGLLYLEAPGWPTSIGSNSKARQHLEKAVALAPDYPENHLCLMEAYLRWEDWKDLRQAMARYTEFLPKAKEALTGDEWLQDWADWDRRWRTLRSEARP